MPLLTYRQAAKKTGRSIRTIKRWRRAGMPMTLNASGMRVVEERILLRWWRDRMKAWPPHQYRLRRARLEEQAEVELESGPGVLVTLNRASPTRST